ncbi:MAG: hypothetical protein JKY11_05090 [Alphaproteobacteria bacterium]|nr:hypothetical protein [Alphaproteobacteria bacterium]
MIKPDVDLTKQISDRYRLTTAEILYRMPDHPSMLQTYIWQEYDLCPKFPELYKFLDFWHRDLDGPLHSVYIASKRIISPAEFGFTDFEITVQ